MHEFEIYEAETLILHFILFHTTVPNANIHLIRRVLRLFSRELRAHESGKIVCV
jgi:hypothetical protein